MKQASEQASEQSSQQASKQASKQLSNRASKRMQASAEAIKPAKKSGSQACVCLQHLMNVDHMVMVEKPWMDINIFLKESSENIWMPTTLHQNSWHIQIFKYSHIWKSGCVQIARWGFGRRGLPTNPSTMHQSTTNLQICSSKFTWI